MVSGDDVHSQLSMNFQHALWPKGPVPKGPEVRNGNTAREEMLLSVICFGVTFWKNIMPNFSSHNF